MLRSGYTQWLWLIGLFFGGFLLSSCEKSPTDFDVEPVSDIPLGRMTMSHVNQYIVARDPRFQQDFGVEVQTNDFEIRLGENKGRLLENDGRTTLDLDIESDDLAQSNYSVLYAVTGQSVIGFHIQLENTTLTDEQHSNGSDPMFCTSTKATLMVSRQEDHPPYTIDTIELPVTAIMNFQEKENDDEDPVLEGNMQILYFDSEKPPPFDETPRILFYSLEADIRIE